jgi:hypothetical protein
MTNRLLLIIGTIIVGVTVVACGGGGSSVSTGQAPSTPTTSAPAYSQSLSAVMTYQNTDKNAQVFNTQVADLNGDGLQDIVVSGWTNEPASYTTSPHGKIPVKILIQQANGTLKDQTDILLGAGNNMIYGSQRIVIADFDNDGKPDIFLGGFQDSPSLPNTGANLCCSPVPSVMFWNNGASFSRYDFAEPVWAHAVCVDDLLGSGRLDIVMGAANNYFNNIYINNGNRSFTMTHISQWIGSGGQCAVIHDATTGNFGIISGNAGYSQVAGYDGVIQMFDRNFNYVGIVGLTGSANPNNSNPPAHDIVNIITTDINGDGRPDMILTDNMTDKNNGKLIALINQGGLAFADQTNSYFPNQSSAYFEYYTQALTFMGKPAIFLDNVDPSYNFSTQPDLWVLSNGIYQPTSQTQLSNDIGPYWNPTLYQAGNGTFYLLLIQANENNYTFYTKPM